MRTIARGIVGENLHGEMALFSFPLASGGEELHAAPLPDPLERFLLIVKEHLLVVAPQNVAAIPPL